MPSNEKTELSPNTTKEECTIIEFKTPPFYRNNNVDISKMKKVKLLKGEHNSRGHKKVTIPHLSLIEGECSVIVDNSDYQIYYNYSGNDVSIGLKNI